MDTPQQIAEDVSRRYAGKEVLGFPYADCRRLLEARGQVFDALIPDLDLFFYSIASPAGSARRLLVCPREDLSLVRQQLSRSFFEKHPEYDSLRELITPQDTPQLYEDLVFHEELRERLLTLLQVLLSSSS